MDDFSLRIKNLPKDDDYGREPEFLKAYLHEHFEAIVKDQKELEDEEKKNNPANMFNQGDV